MTKAVYAGSFDPPTNGHLWVVREAAKLFDEVVVLVSSNPTKESLFAEAERMHLFAAAASDVPKVRIERLGNRYVARYAREIGAGAMIRGIRNETDFGFEQMLQNINLTIDPSIRSVFLVPPNHIADVSSSAVKMLIGPEGWERYVAPLVPKEIFVRLIAKAHRWVTGALVAQGARVPDDFWEQLLFPYFDPARAYHTWLHVCEGLNELKAVLAQVPMENPGIIGLSWLAHDRFYDVSRTDNELRSAQWVQDFALSMGLSEEFSAKCFGMVGATQQHHSTDPDTKVLISVDLAILGQAQDRFDEYEQGVAKEYGSLHTPQEVRVGRAGWIVKFLRAHPECIYPVPFFEEKYGARARANLERSFANLKSLS